VAPLVGAITAHNESQISEAKFRDLRIEPSGRCGASAFSSIRWLGGPSGAERLA
jgi:hypothetical protein